LAIFLGVFFSVPFVTLLERKLLSYAQLRKGPKKVSWGGILQPIADGIKLVLKEGGFPVNSKALLFWVSPFLLFCLLSVQLVCLGGFVKVRFVVVLSAALFLVFSSLHVFPLFVSGISRSSKYTVIGSFRGVAQVVSYEVSVIFVLFVPCCFYFRYRVIEFS
jgi:NADH-quinone oxidoreductase subunit H